MLSEKRYILKMHVIYAAEDILNEKEKINYHIIKPVQFESPIYGYFVTGEKVGDCAKMKK